ncbi:methionine synthase reductase [Drosophila eugracilis]|uniref:methionine synthase reductase n=1 Tax=Drosophila eugracilis TaxID=29029 RepID=UPI001BD9425F|nr:methionine synthase reductase [Drosophila eugracilis]
MDIGAYILNEYIPAKPLVGNLEAFFTDEEKIPIETCAQLRCGEGLKFPFARLDSQPSAVAIKESKVIVAADKATETKRVVELTLESSFDYQPGDTIGILPSNRTEIVDRLLHQLELIDKADTTCHLKLALHCAKKNAKLPAHIPPETTPREILTQCLSLNCLPQKQLLSALAGFTRDDKERSFLACLSSKQATSHYQSLILEQGLLFTDIMELCGSCRPPLAFLVEHLPRLLPRPYSIANSPLEAGDQELRVIYSLLSHKPGVTTSMLEAKALQIDAEQHTKVVIYPRLSNAFRYTEQDLGSNQILIAVGTGLAPFLSFLTHKEYLIKQQPQQDKGHSWLYIGAKKPEAILKREKLQSWQQSSVLQRLRMCHSRGESPNYVQQMMSDDADDLITFLLKPETVLYLCADGAKISQSIANGLNQCLQKVLHITEEEASQQLKELKTKGKYREDVWL